MKSLPDGVVDCLVVGAGPAGLAAATYLARYERSVVVIDGGNSRASQIQRSHNLPGFPKGISGPRLLDKLREQSVSAGVTVAKGSVSRVVRARHGFVATVGKKAIKGRRVLLATGCGDRKPLPGLSRAATWRGEVRWCPICDGHESKDRRVVLIGDAAHGLEHARFLRTYTRDVALVLAADEKPMSRADLRALAEAGIEFIPQVPVRVRFRRGQPGCLDLLEGESRRFDVVYPMTGGLPHVDLAVMLGAKLARDGRLEVDAGQQTSVPGLYAAGDVVASLAQIAVAVSEGAVAATAIHNSLAANFR